MLILSDKWITTKCQPPDLRAWVADRAAVARLGPDNPAAASGTSHHPPPSPRRIGCSFGSSWIRNSRQRRWRLPSSTPHSR